MISAQALADATGKNVFTTNGKITIFDNVVKLAEGTNWYKLQPNSTTPQLLSNANDIPVNQCPNCSGLDGVEMGVQGAGQATLLTKFKDFTNIKSWISGLDDIADASLLSKIDNLETSYFAKLEGDLASVSNGAEIKGLLKTADDVDVWKTLKDDPAYAWELGEEGLGNWEKWSKGNFFKQVCAKGKAFETDICLPTFKNRSSAKYLEL